MKVSSFLLTAAVVSLLACLTSATALLLPLVTASGVATTVSVSATTLAAGVAGGVLGLGLAALLASRRGEEETTSYARHRREVDDDRLDEILAMVAKMDSNGCGMRHVCQIFSKPENALSLRDQTIKLLIGEKPEPVSTEHVKPRALYQSAALLGLKGENCHKYYEMCPLSYNEVEEYLDTLNFHEE